MNVVASSSTLTLFQARGKPVSDFGKQVLTPLLNSPGGRHLLREDTVKTIKAQKLLAECSMSNLVNKLYRKSVKVLCGGSLVIITRIVHSLPFTSWGTTTATALASRIND